MKTKSFVLVVALCLCGCFLTVAPKPVVSHAASYEGNVQNSGIVSADADGFVVTQHFLDRHHITDYVQSGQYFRITAQTMDIAVEQDVARRQPK